MSGMSQLERLRRHAVSHSLFPETTLSRAIRRLGFVQADPIRSPARAQDLILRHRVRAYRVGDLDRRYRSLKLEEDVLYAYGFLPRKVWHLLHPRKSRPLSKLEKQVLAAVRRSGVTHPGELRNEFGVTKVRNAWGGQSKATTAVLESLRAQGLLRVAGRDKGVRLYEEAFPPKLRASDDRLTELIMTVASLLAPVREKSLYACTARYRYIADPRAAVRRLVDTGRLQGTSVDGVGYVWPSTKVHGAEVPASVRFLAPFDPLVCDRDRFDQLWGWPYRFEAYVPAKQRLRGYYAMPMLWRDEVVGWANAAVENGELDVDVGFASAKPRGRDFRNALECEIEGLRTFLSLDR